MPSSTLPRSSGKPMCGQRLSSAKTCPPSCTSRTGRWWPCTTSRPLRLNSSRVPARTKSEIALSIDASCAMVRRSAIQQGCCSHVNPASLDRQRQHIGSDSRQRTWGSLRKLIMSPRFDPAITRRRFLQFLAASPLFTHPGAPALAQSTSTPSRLADPMVWAPRDLDTLISDPEEALDVFDFEPVAKKNLPPAHFGYMVTGIDDEVT